MSVFILSGDSLKATVEINGPLDGTINSGSDLLNAASKWDSSGRHSGSDFINVNAVVDFEHLNIGPSEEEFLQHLDELLKSQETDEETDAVDERRDRRALARKKALEAKEHREAQKRKQRKKVRDEGEPFSSSITAPSAGWYRFCVVGTYHQVNAEVDVRKESDFGGLDDNGNVWTLQQKTLDEEEKLIEEDTAESEGIKDEDFESTKEKLKVLRRLLAEIQSKQSQERHRLIVHSATNEHSHSRMVLSSLLETILFMLVTGFQVFTIRRWFKSAPVLGR